MQQKTGQKRKIWYIECVVKKIMKTMKKFFLGVLALIVPVFLVVYAGQFVNYFVTEKLSFIIAGYMMSYTMITIFKSRKKLKDVFGYMVAYNAALAFIYTLLVFIEAWVLLEGFDSYAILNFPPMLATIAYIMLILAVVAVRSFSKDPDCWYKATMAFWIYFAISVAFAGIYYALKPYGAVLPDWVEDILVIMVIVGICGFFGCGYKMIYDDRKC